MVAPLGRGRRLAGPAATVAVLAALWWLLADGNPASWLVGVPAVAAAAWAAHALGGGHTRGLSVTGLARFAPFFLWESLRGGLDVVARTLAPRPAIDPGFIDYPLTLTSPTARVFFVNCVSLVPGTLAAELDGDRVVVHVLARGSDPVAGLKALEAAVAGVFREAAP